MPASFLDRVNQKCTICGDAITLRRYRFLRTCEKLKCVFAIQQQRRVADKKHLALELKNQAATIQGAAEKYLDGPVPDDLVTLPIPVFLKTIQPLSEHRRELFRVHLKQQIDDVFNGDEKPVEVSSDSAQGTESKPVSSQTSIPTDQRVDDHFPAHSAESDVFSETACATCRGACCSNGGDKAYLDPDVIRKYLRQKPGTKPNEILADYVNRLPEQSYEESCGFHSESGCNLPRTMRSSVCNNFGCRQLVAIDEYNGDQLFLVALDDQSRVIRTRLVDKKHL